MATIDDVEQGMCNALAGLLYPGTNYQFGEIGSCVAPWLGAPGAPTLTMQTRLYIGEPSSAELEEDIAANISNVGVMRIQGMTRNATQFLPHWQQVTRAAPTFTVAIGGPGVVFGGIAGPGMVVGVTTSKVCYARRLCAADTPASVAASFAAMIPGASATGAALACGPVAAARVVADQTAFYATGQQETVISVTVLATAGPGENGYLKRAALGRLVAGLKSLLTPEGNLTRFIGLADGTSARILAEDERDDDTPKRDDVWRRWFSFRCLFDEGVLQIQPGALAPLLLVGTGAGQIFWADDGPNMGSVLSDGAGNVIGDLSGTMLGSFS
jgi:hypothetical protein